MAFVTILLEYDKGADKFVSVGNKLDTALLLVYVCTERGCHFNNSRASLVMQDG